MLKVVPDELKNPEIGTSMVVVGSGMTFEVDHCGDGDELALCLLKNIWISTFCITITLVWRCISNVKEMKQ